MNRDLRHRVSAHAKLVRDWAEEENQKRDIPSPPNLVGWCAISSAKLHKELSDDGIFSEIHMAINNSGVAHVFLVVEDYVVDVTATQFSEFRNQKVVIIHLKEAETFWFYQSCDVFDSGSELRTHQMRTGWPIRQTAHA